MTNAATSFRYCKAENDVGIAACPLRSFRSSLSLQAEDVVDYGICI